MTRRARAALAAGVAALLMGPAASPGAGPAPFVPAQFIAKTYTEVLGRLPDDAGWNHAVAHFQRSGCSARSLSSWALGVYGSAELAAFGYGPEALALVVHRGALNRDPDPAGLQLARLTLGRGAPVTDLARSLFDGPEFSLLAGRICTTTNYHWGTTPPVAIGPEIAELDLRQRLADAAARGGGTVALPQRSLVRLTSTLVVPSGVLLTTAGAPRRQAYASMARLVRTGPIERWDRELVRVEDGASLARLWIDGQRNQPENKRDRSYAVYVRPGTAGTQIVHNKVANALGNQTIKLGGNQRSVDCAQRVHNNLVTVYASAPGHDLLRNQTLWTDGIFSVCSRAVITRNEVVDATDVGIIVMHNRVTPMANVVRSNRVLQAGNDSFGALLADPYWAGDVAHPVSFEGTRFERNVVWTGPHTRLSVALALGSRPWAIAGVGTGASMVNNTTGAMSVRATQMLSVSGMIEAATAGNGGAWLPVGNFGNSGCQVAASVVHPVYASGRLQPHVLHDNSGCIKP